VKCSPFEAAEDDESVEKLELAEKFGVRRHRRLIRRSTWFGRGGGDASLENLDEFPICEGEAYYRHSELIVVQSVISDSSQIQFAYPITDNVHT